MPTMKTLIKKISWSYLLTSIYWATGWIMGDDLENPVYSSTTFPQCFPQTTYTTTGKYITRKLIMRQFMTLLRFYLFYMQTFVYECIFSSVLFYHMCTSVQPQPKSRYRTAGSHISFLLPFYKHSLPPSLPLTPGL